MTLYHKGEAESEDAENGYDFKALKEMEWKNNI